VVLTVLLVCGGVFLWTYRQPKFYSATCTIIIDPSAPRILNNNVTDVVQMGSGSYWADIQFYQTQYKIIGSKEVARRVAERLGLGADPDYPYPKAGTPGKLRDVTGSVMGAGATRRLSAIRWGVAGNILFAWVLTLPAAGLVAAALYFPVRWVF